MSVVEQKETWATSRRNGLGGTDAAAILGLSPWRRPIEVWEDKVHPERRAEVDKDCLRWGVLLEPVIRQEYARKFDIEVTAPADMGALFPNSKRWEDSTIITGRHPWMLGMPDGYLASTRTGLEIKTASRRSDEWGAPSSDEIPAQYLMQCAWYMATTETPAWNVAVLFSGSDLQQYRVVRDLDLERDAIAACREFWEEYVLKRVEPPIDESESYGRYLARKFSLNSGAILKNPSPEIVEAAGNLRDAQQSVKDAEDAAQLRKNQLAALLADADAAFTPYGKVQWVRPGPRKTVDWKGVVAHFDIHSEELEQFTNETPVSAYVRGYWRK